MSFGHEQNIVDYDEEKITELLLSYRNFSWSPAFSTVDTDRHHYLQKMRYHIRLEGILSGYSCTKKIAYLIRWLHRIVLPNTIQLPYYAYDSLTMIQKCQLGYGLNCAGYAVILNDLFLAHGLKARCIWCLSEDPSDMECHVVNHVFNTDINKWVIADSAFGGYVASPDGVGMDILDLRSKIPCGGDYNLFTWPHSKRTIEYTKRYFHYLKKNLFMFVTPQLYNHDNTIDLSSFVSIVPCQYSSKAKIKNCQVTNNACYLYTGM